MEQQNLVEQQQQQRRVRRDYSLIVTALTFVNVTIVLSIVLCCLQLIDGTKYQLAVRGLLIGAVVVGPTMIFAVTLGLILDSQSRFKFIPLLTITQPILVYVTTHFVCDFFLDSQILDLLSVLGLTLNFFYVLPVNYLLWTKLV